MEINALDGYTHASLAFFWYPVGQVEEGMQEINDFLESITFK